MQEKMRHHPAPRELLHEAIAPNSEIYVGIDIVNVPYKGNARHRRFDAGRSRDVRQGSCGPQAKSGKVKRSPSQSAAHAAFPTADSIANQGTWNELEIRLVFMRCRHAPSVLVPSTGNQ